VDLSKVVDPIEITDLTADELFAIPAGEIEEMRLRFAQRRFAENRPKVEFLDKLAKNQQLDEINELDDLVPVLFAHTAYKSYPISLLENSRFDRLTQWLGQLTSHDVSHLDVTGIDTIEDWLLLIEAETPVRIATSSATSGKVSFLPRSLDEMSAFHATYRQMTLPFHDERGFDLNNCDLALIQFNYRYGFNVNHQRLEELISHVAKSDDRCYALFPGRLSPDMLSLAGRIATAHAKGSTAKVNIPTALAARHEEFVQFQKDRPKLVRQFVERLSKELAGQQVATLGGWTSILDAIFIGEEMGIKNLFSPDSLVTTGGGLKGRLDVPDDYKERALAFFGVPDVIDTYGMTEETAYTKRCPHDHYHVPPYMVPFVLDPDTGESLGRRGTTTGRFAFFDPFALTYWGGFISGDAVTLHWDGGCPCGRTGGYLDGEVTRYSALRGGDDRISCAGSPDAYDSALAYILESL
jgi:hypothetical protein